MNYVLFLQLQTIIVFTVAIFLIGRRLFKCFHDWSVLSEKEFPSRIKELRDNGVQSIPWAMVEDIHQLGSRTYFAVVACKKCGSLRTFREES